MDTGKVGIKWKRLDVEGEGKIESHDDNVEERKIVIKQLMKGCKRWKKEWNKNSKEYNRTKEM